MKLATTTILTTLLLGFSTTAMAGEIAAIGHITAVTVYSDRATITREAEIDVPAGASTAVFADLPAAVLANSLRAEGKADVAVTLGALESKLVNGSELAGDKERALDDQLQALRDKMDLSKAQSQANESRVAFLHKLGDQAAVAANTDFVHMDLKPEQWSAGSASIYTSMGEALKTGVALGIEQRALTQQISALSANLNQVRTGQRSTMRVVVPLDAPQATKLTLKISYQLPGATWRPVYDARVDTKTAKLALTEFGEVRQSTGEDWKNIALVLSTAEPAVGAAAPRIEPELVDLQQEYVAGKDRDYARASNGMAYKNAESSLAVSAPAGKIDEPMAQFVPTPVTPPKPAIYLSAAIDTGGFVSEYRIPGQATIAADNTASKVMIGVVDSTTTLFEQVRPALSAHAFLMAKVKIAGESPLLPGDASLFRDGVFIGSETLPLLRPGEESRVSLGIDDQIAVKQQTQADNQGTSGVISKNQTRERRVVTTIHNLHKTPIELEVLQAVPSPRNEAVKLDMLADATTQGYTTDTEKVAGLDLWKLTVAAGESAEIKLGWILTWPADKQLSWSNGGDGFTSYNQIQR